MTPNPPATVYVATSKTPPAGGSATTITGTARPPLKDVEM
jgi:hypothetical protein